MVILFLYWEVCYSATNEPLEMCIKGAEGKEMHWRGLRGEEERAKYTMAQLQPSYTVISP